MRLTTRAWNGIEVYTNFRDRKVYNDLEVELQHKIGEVLTEKSPNLASLVPMAEAMTKKYDEVIALSVKGPALHPLFDDVATVRIVRADLRIVSAALQAGDVAKARTSYGKFKTGYAQAKPLMVARMGAGEADVTPAMASRRRQDRGGHGRRAQAPGNNADGPLQLRRQPGQRRRTQRQPGEEGPDRQGPERRRRTERGAGCPGSGAEGVDRCRLQRGESRARKGGRGVRQGAALASGQEQRREPSRQRWITTQR